MQIMSPKRGERSGGSEGSNTRKHKSEEDALWRETVAQKTARLLRLKIYPHAQIPWQTIFWHPKHTMALTDRALCGVVPISPFTVLCAASAKKKQYLPLLYMLIPL
jgi:hypothetical protein